MATTADEMSGGAAKRVKFSGADNERKPFTPLVKSKKRPKKQDRNKLISGIWVRLSQERHFEHLRTVLDQFGLQDVQAIRDYFNQEGPYLLRCGTAHWRDPDPLGFICEYVPEDILKEKIREEDYANVRGFLLGHTYLEEKGLVDDERLRERREKLQYLLKIDLEGLEAFMESDFFKSRLSPGVKASFQEAVKECKSKRIAHRF